MRTIAITGAASGMGAATRRLLAESGGHRIIGVDLREEEIEADLSTEDGRSFAVERITELSGGRLDGLVLCAGLGPHVRPSSAIVAVNYFGTVPLLDALRPLLEQGDAPAAVTIASNSIGVIPMDDQSLIEAMLASDEPAALDLSAGFDGATTYGMTKMALARAVRHRAESWGAADVRLNAVAPGPVNTPLLQGSIDDEVLGPLLEFLPMPLQRNGEVDEIAAVVAFLLSPAASIIHGSVVFADGGTDAQCRPDHA